MPQNHVIDPTFFWDAIDEFAFNYDLYSETGKTVDEYGKRVLQYTHYTVNGSLQPSSTNISRDKKGNIVSKGYNFYCKSLYRININDIIKYKNIYLIVNSVMDYDEYGVRSCSLSMIDLAAYRDLADYVKYIEGTKIV